MILGHTGCHRGKKVRVKLRDGRIIIDKFYERTKNAIILKDAGKIRKDQLLSFSIYKGV